MKAKDKERLTKIVEEMQSLVSHGDNELAHAAADLLVAEALQLLGQNELARLYDEVPKWYS